MKLLLLLISLCVTTSACARVWTNDQGRTVEADLLRLEGREAVVVKSGQEMKLPVGKLSAADQAYLQRWEREQTVVAAARNVLLDGKLLEKGGKINLLERSYSAKLLQQLKAEQKTEETGFKLALVLPTNFNPAQLQHLFVVSTAVNNEAERLAGNIGKMSQYAKSCLEQGWVCLALDSNNGYPSTFGALSEAMDWLTKAWPALRSSSYAVGGFSGGAKSCHANAAWLLQHKYHVVGVFMGGCNRDHSGIHRELFKLPTTAYAELRAFISTGDEDPLVSAEQVAEVRHGLTASGVGEVRSEGFAGGHTFHEPHFSAALKWFAEPKPGK